MLAEESESLPIEVGKTGRMGGGGGNEKLSRCAPLPPEMPHGAEPTDSATPFHNGNWPVDTTAHRHLRTRGIQPTAVGGSWCLVNRYGPLSAGSWLLAAGQATAYRSLRGGGGVAAWAPPPHPTPPTHITPEEKKETYQRGLKLEVNFRYTFFLSL